LARWQPSDGRELPVRVERIATSASAQKQSEDSVTYSINETHDPALRSWVESAQGAATDFPIQNLPFGVFRRRGRPERSRIGIAIGSMILNLAECCRDGMLETVPESAREAVTESSLNGLMSLRPEHWSALRLRVSRLLRSGSSEAASVARRAGELLIPMQEAELQLPAHIGDYTDFYASLFHATHVGCMFRPESPLLPNYKWVPVGYHGRSSSIVIGGTPVRRPFGQMADAEGTRPEFAPSRNLDYELEMGFFVGQGNPLGERIPVGEARSHMFGLCLVNDWSARDIQRWEYQPLGPFLAKSFATTVSPWVVTVEALEPYRTPALVRPADDPAPLPYLSSADDLQRGGFDIEVEAWLSSRRMRENGLPPLRTSRANLKDMYWTMSQMLAHHTSNGCNLRPGDLIATGTISGSTPQSAGSLLELTWRGTQPLELPTGELRGFLEDGDEVFLRGCCSRLGFAAIGFGDCRGMVVAASP
jgi:fumarylacetoacetase